VLKKVLFPAKGLGRAFLFLPHSLVNKKRPVTRPT
jgi:hypothetical protein